MQRAEFVTKENAESLTRTKSIPIHLLKPSRYQVRDNAFFDKEELENLAASIKSIGLSELPKIRVSPEDPEFFEIISGHRRIRAASEILGWKEIECKISEFSDELRIVQLSLEENIQRHNLSSYEEGVAFLLVEKMFGLSQEQIAERFHQSRATVQNKRQLAASANTYLKFADPSCANAFLRHANPDNLAVLSKLDTKNVKHGIKMISRGASIRHLERFVNVFGKIAEEAEEKETSLERCAESAHSVAKASGKSSEYNQIQSKDQLLQFFDQLIDELPGKQKQRAGELREALGGIFANRIKTICPKCGFVVNESWDR